MRRVAAALIAGVLALPVAASADLLAFRDIGELSIEDLAALTITSVARQETRLDEAAASIYVITAEDIRRSGATTIPEILRLAPNLQVARIGSTGYAITARGFNNAVGNKLLVLIDGRTVYTPVYSGVFWEMQDTMIEDIDRVEVISGPGATMWGANAVNGVINITTRASADTQGTLVTADGGTDERGAAARYGGALGDTGAFRVYARTRDWDHTRWADGTSARDPFERHQVGFRADWGGERDRYTVQGDAFRGTTGHRGFVGAFEIPAHTIAGHNLLGRWTRRTAAGGEVQVQAYWDSIDREEIIVFQPEVDKFDLEFQHAIPLNAHRLVWGAGYRRSSDDVTPGFFSTFIPREKTLEWANVFAQGELRVARDVAATVGLKLEHNDFTGIEYLPTIRLAWQPLTAHTVWASASRAVRTPSRYDRNVFFPEDPPFVIAGGPGFESEVARVYELGYRAQPSPAFSYSVTAFRHDWSRLRSGSGTTLPAQLANHIEGRASGAEAWANWQAAPRWRLMGGVLLLDKSLAFRPGTTDTIGTDNPTLHNDPDYQLFLRSRADLGERWELDIQLRHVAALEVEPVPSYTELDLRVGWRATDNLDIAVIGHNLLESSHAEFGDPATRSELERSALLRVEWRF